MTEITEEFMRDLLRQMEAQAQQAEAHKQQAHGAIWLAKQVLDRLIVPDDDDEEGNG